MFHLHLRPGFARSREDIGEREIQFFFKHFGETQGLVESPKPEPFLRSRDRNEEPLAALGISKKFLKDREHEPGERPGEGTDKLILKDVNRFADNRIGVVCCDNQTTDFFCVAAPVPKRQPPRADRADGGGKMKNAPAAFLAKERLFAAAADAVRREQKIEQKRRYVTRHGESRFEP